jgi:hypothetical protein
VAPPRIDTKDARKFDSVVEAEVFTGLKYGSKAWTGTTNPRIFRIYLKVKPEFNEDDKSRFAFDAVVAVRCKANDPLVLHGFDIRSALSLYTEQQAKFLELATPFCDRLWTAVRETTLEIGQVVIPHNVGILSVRGQALSVLRTATTTAHSGIRSADLAKGLLFVAPAQ